MQKKRFNKPVKTMDEIVLDTKAVVKDKKENDLKNRYLCDHGICL